MMSPAAVLLELLFYVLSCALLPLVILTALVYSIFYRKIWFPVPLALVGGIIGGYAGVFLAGLGILGSDSGAPDTSGLGSAVNGITTLGFAETGFFLGLAAGFWMKRKYGEARGLLFFGLVVPFLFAAIWLLR